MKAELKTTTAIKLTLTEEEALWLQDYMQNPICSTQIEDFKTRELRRALWGILNATNSVFKPIKK